MFASNIDYLFAAHRLSSPGVHISYELVHMYVDHHHQPVGFHPDCVNGQAAVVLFKSMVGHDRHLLNCYWLGIILVAGGGLNLYKAKTPHAYTTYEKVVSYFTTKGIEGLRTSLKRPCDTGCPYRVLLRGPCVGHSTIINNTTAAEVFH